MTRISFCEPSIALAVVGSVSLLLISITIQVVESTQVNTVVGLGTNGYTHLELLLMPSQNSGAPVHQKQKLY